MREFVALRLSSFVIKKKVNGTITYKIKDM
jgi:hypothetical protein